MAEEKKKIWLVLQSVPSSSLEDKLNEYARLGYQAFRIDRIVDRVGRLGYNTVFYDVIMLNPVLFGEINAAAMAEMMMKTGAAVASQAQANAPGPVPTR